MAVREVAGRWAEETGENAERLARDLGEWYAAYLVENAYMSEGDAETVPADRQIWRDTLKDYCAERGKTLPAFWFGPQAEMPAPEYPGKAAMAKWDEKTSAPDKPGAEQPAFAAAAAEQNLKDSAPPRRPRRRGRRRLVGSVLGVSAVAVLAAAVATEPARVADPVPTPRTAHADGQALAYLVRRELTDAGYAPGSAADGLTAAIRSYQEASGLLADGALSQALLFHIVRRNLGAESAEPPTEPAAHDAAARPVETSAQPAERTAAVALTGPALVRAVQENLSGLGFDPGPADGRPGPRTRDAIKAFQRVLGLTPDGAATTVLLRALEARTFEREGLAAYSKGAYTQAIAAFDRMIAREPDRADGYFNRALAYEKARRPDRALADFAEAVRLDPTHAAAYFGRGELNLRSGRFGAAMTDYVGAVRAWLGSNTG